MPLPDIYKTIYNGMLNLSFNKKKPCNGVFNVQVKVTWMREVFNAFNTIECFRLATRRSLIQLNMELAEHGQTCRVESITQREKEELWND